MTRIWVMKINRCDPERDMIIKIHDVRVLVEAKISMREKRELNGQFHSPWSRLLPFDQHKGNILGEIYKIIKALSSLIKKLRCPTTRIPTVCRANPIHVGPCPCWPVRHTALTRTDPFTSLWPSTALDWQHAMPCMLMSHPGT